MVLGVRIVVQLRIGVVVLAFVAVAVGHLLNRRIRAVENKYQFLLASGGRGERRVGGRLTMGSPSTTPPTVWRRGDVMPPTMGRPFVVSSTVPRSLENDISAVGLAISSRREVD